MSSCTRHRLLSAISVPRAVQPTAPPPPPGRRSGCLSGLRATEDFNRGLLLVPVKGWSSHPLLPPVPASGHSWALPVPVGEGTSHLCLFSGILLGGHPVHTQPLKEAEDSTLGVLSAGSASRQFSGTQRLCVTKTSLLSASTFDPQERGLLLFGNGPSECPLRLQMLRCGPRCDSEEEGEL